MMNGQYVIGVDGGNSKTDYFLFGLDGSLAGHLRDGTCSHERFADGYESSCRIIKQAVGTLLGRAGLSMADIAAAAFGLAGADISSQKARLGEVVERIGFTRYALDNDSFLGLKAGTDKGYGVCSISGSGSVTGGISPSGRRLQIGGVGSELAGDEAGGFYLGRRVLGAVYDSLYRMGPPTQMAERVMTMLNVPDTSLFLESVWEATLSRTVPNTELIQLLFYSAEAGDSVARGIIVHSAQQLALSTAGCMTNLDFGQEVDVVLAGSVWTKVESPLLLNAYKEFVSDLVPQTCRFLMLKEPPATGAVLWALELAYGETPDEQIRRKVFEAVRGL